MLSFCFPSEGELEHRNSKIWLGLLALAVMALAAGARTPTLAQEPSSGQSEPTPTPDVESATPPMVTLHPFPSYGPAPLTVGFILGTNLEQDDPIVSYQWNFGDGAVSTVPPHVLFHTYRQPGSYVVTVSITTADGRVGTGIGAVIAAPPAR
jgi:hypothetical protein